MNILFDYIADLIVKNSEFSKEQILPNLETPAQDRGDVALPCFKYSKDLHLAPNVIAQNLASKIADENLLKIESIGGFLNFTFKPDFLAKTLMQNLLINEKEVADFFGMQDK